MMRISTAVVAAFLGGSSLAASAAPVGGTNGPYAVVIEQDPTLPDHTVFRPARLDAVKGRVPVVAFGNGGCINIGNRFQAFLAEVASNGYVVTAPGAIAPVTDPATGNADSAARPPQSKPGQMIAALDWAEREAVRRGSLFRGKLDLKHVAVMGQSCGGLEAIAAGQDPRVRTVVVLNSGIIRGGIPNRDGTTREPSGYLPASIGDLGKLHTPIAYFIGGKGDQAYRGAEGDFADIKQVPVFNANIDKGHVGTWREPHGGVMGAAAISWLNWQLRGDPISARDFKGVNCGLCRNPLWTVKKKGME